MDALILPTDGDLSQIPSDPNNPITLEKVTLGKLLFHETGLALNPKQEIGRGTYSCASCHHAAAGFQSGNLQGIGEGGSGFGLTGGARIMSLDYLEEDLDVQPLKSPTVLNTAYQTNTLWNGQFGATGVNIGTEDKWTTDTPKGTNNLGFEGVEIGLMDTYNIFMLFIFSIAAFALSQLLWIKAAGSLGILFASLHMNAVPFYVMVVMVTIFDASWSWMQALGALLVGVGVVYSQMKQAN